MGGAFEKITSPSIVKNNKNKDIIEKKDGSLEYIVQKGDGAYGILLAMMIKLREPISYTALKNLGEKIHIEPGNKISYTINQITGLPSISINGVPYEKIESHKREEKKDRRYLALNNLY